jgi:hypothetical protein
MELICDVRNRLDDMRIVLLLLITKLGIDLLTYESIDLPGRILSRLGRTTRGCRVFELKDPAGHIVEIFEVDSQAAAPGLSLDRT